MTTATYIVEIDYEDEHTEFTRTMMVPADSENEAVEIAERDPGVKIARVHGTIETL